MATVKLGDLVEASWLDAWSDAEETSVDDFKDRCLVTTVGQLIRRTDTHVSIAGEWFPEYAEKSYRNVTHIPIVMLTGPMRKLA